MTARYLIMGILLHILSLVYFKFLSYLISFDLPMEKLKNQTDSGAQNQSMLFSSVPPFFHYDISHFSVH